MNKTVLRVAGCAFLIIIILAVLGSIFLCSLNGRSISQFAFDIITHTRKLNADLDVSEIIVDGANAHRCEAEDWWLASIDREALAKGAYSPPVSVKTEKDRRYAAVLRSAVTAESVEQDEPLYIVVYTLRGYNILRLRFTTLPITTLTTDGTPTLAEDVPIELNGASGTAHLRGQSTQRFYKRSYRITLDQKKSFLGMRKDDDWILYAAYNDQEKVRNVFSSNLWYDSCAGNNQFGVENGYEYRFTELFLNGNYAGLYALGYKPDQKQFKIGDGEYLYSKVGYEDMPYKLHGGKTKSNEAAAWDALESDYLYDEGSSVDLWLFTNLCAAIDNTGKKNIYLALKKNSQDELTAVYSPWDLDLSWGNKYNSELLNNTEEYAVPAEFPCDMRDGLISQLLADGDETVAGKIKARYRELRSSSWSDKSLLRAVDECEADIFFSGAYRRDISTWPGCSQQEPELGLSLFREYLLARLTWMDSYIEELSPACADIE